MTTPITPQLLVDLQQGGAGPSGACVRLLAGAAMSLCGAHAASVSLHDEESGELVLVGLGRPDEQHLVGRRFPASSGLAGWTLASSESLIVDDARADPRFASAFAQQTGYVPVRMAVAPVVVDDEACGVVQVLDFDSSVPVPRIAEGLELLGACVGLVISALRTAPAAAEPIDVALGSLAVVFGELGRGQRREVAASLVELAGALR